MKKLLCVLLLIAFSLPAIAQREYKPERHIYLWDVTLSMKGETYPNGVKVYNPEQDIYDRVVDFLEGDIRSKNINSDSRIIVCPFQASKGVLEEWLVEATNEGKNKIISQIRNYQNNTPTLTDIVSAISYAKERLIDSAAINYLMILTDGSQSSKLGGDEALINSIKDWKLAAKINNAYAFYLMLGYEQEAVMAQESPEFTPISLAHPGENKFIQLRPENIRKTVKDAVAEKSVVLRLMPNVNLPISSKLMLKVALNDTRGILKNTSLELPVVFDGGNIGAVEIPLEFNFTYEELKNDKLQPDEEVVLLISIQLQNNNGHKSEIINLTQERVDLKLVNKIEKTVVVRLKTE